MNHEIQHKLAAALGELLTVTTMGFVSEHQIQDTKKYVRELLTTDEAGFEYWVPQNVPWLAANGFIRVHLYSGRIEKLKDKDFDSSAHYYQLRTMDQAQRLAFALTGISFAAEFVEA